MSDYNNIQRDERLKVRAFHLLFVFAFAFLLFQLFNLCESENRLPFEINPKINVNVCLESDLILLPGIGPALAKRILEYRSNHAYDHNNGKAFEKPSDLAKVKGIGIKKTEAILPYIEF